VEFPGNRRHLIVREGDERKVLRWAAGRIGESYSPDKMIFEADGPYGGLLVEKALTEASCSFLAARNPPPR
jgi:hypothetical protein